MIDQLKEEIDEQDLLIELGAEKIRGDGNPRYTMLCLSPNHADNSPSFMYRTDRHTFKCYSCGVQGDVVDLVSLVRSLDFKESLKFLKEFANWTGSFDEDQLNNILEKRRKLLEVKDDHIESIKYPAYFCNDFTSAGDAIQIYQKRRRWSSNLLADFGIGYCEHGHFRNRIVFPIYNSDKSLVSFAARDVTNTSTDKYLYPLDCPIGKIIWGLHKQIEGTPIFVEGIADALRLREYGFNSYAILGNQLGEYKVKLIRSIFKSHRDILVIPDNDDGGSILLQWFQKLIHDFNVKVGLFNKGKDIDEMDKPDIEKVIFESVLLPDFMVKYHMKESELPSMVTQIKR